ncbi:MAG: DUF3368 domain-containing protein [Bacteroidetes bacterium]|nr:DUF3368 domain-containing protein [Bacteroidota bacterium]
MPRVYLLDTSCIITLVKVELLFILKELYGSVLTTPEVVNEYGFNLPEWIVIQSVPDTNYQKILEASLDKGESSILALGLSIPDSILVLDDLKARKYAQRIGFEITGTLGILFKAKSAGIIPEIKPVLEQLKIIGFRISENVEIELMRLSGE